VKEKRKAGGGERDGWKAHTIPVGITEGGRERKR